MSNLMPMPVAKRSTQSQQIDAVLASLMAIRGVVAAAVVDSDGFVTHLRRNFDINNDALGAAVQVTLGAAAQAAHHVTQGNTDMVLLENKDGLVLLAPLAKGFSITVVADRSVMLGSLRFEVKQAIPLLVVQF